MRASGWLCALLLAGCASSSFDLGATGTALRGHPPPPSPVLVESPPAALPGPTGIRATRGELREIAVAWDPVLAGQVSGYAVERSLAQTGPFLRIAVLTDRFETGLLDRGFDLAPKAPQAQGEPGLGDGASYYYRVRAFDAQGHLSQAFSGVVAAQTAPPPEPPEGLRVVSRLPRKVALAWRPSSDPTVRGYVVLRSPGAAGPFEPIAKVDGRHRTHYLDRGLGDLEVFHYEVRAVNAAGAYGPPGEPVQGLTKPDPLPPVGLRIEARDASSTLLAWEPNVEPDIVAYRVLRRRSGDDDAEVVATVRAPATSLRDDEASDAVSYRVIAIDADGLESAPAELAASDPDGGARTPALPSAVAAPAQ
ncbi:MAG: hypothetical protein IT386_05050 [Deltaproteobacteria bacterium]|nr:hypothetical protein [Deltaproteobacteria bacterium]